jgi:aminoglycoside phosphotransferase family enzyme/predicted kinase
MCGAEAGGPGPLVRDLRRREAWGPGVEEVGFLETHVSWLFFVGERVYKVKRPVDLGFIDATTLERRRFFCDEEVRLNRRLAPRVYLGVVAIVRGSDGCLRLEREAGRGEAVEWAVEMVRLPEQRMLASLLERGEIDNARMNAAASTLARFHEGCPTGAGIDEHGAPDAVARNAGDNLDALAAHVDDPERGRSGLGVLTPRQLAFLRARLQAFVAGRGALLERRVREGRIRDGHGDLHAGNLCFVGDELVAYDCVEFSRALRCGDVASDLAFLAMDNDRRGFPAFSRWLVRRYAQAAGDGEVADLVGFYKGYRALVRAKVATLTAGGAAHDAGLREAKRSEAMRYVQLALAYELPPALILTVGLPACGKTWLAERIAAPLRAIVLHSDVRRKTLTGIAPTTRVEDGMDAGLYSPERKRATYRSLLGDALERLAAGHTVIVDATFSRREYRAPYVDAAVRLGLPYYVVHVTAPERVIRTRLEARRDDPREASDADLDVYLRARETFEPPTEVPARHVLQVVSGCGPPEEQSSTVLERMIALRDGD